MNRSPLVGVLLSFAFLFSGCGGDDGTGPGDGGGNGYTPPAAYGFFLDDAVEGLGYESGGAARRLTDEHGAFEIDPGESTTFYVGDLLIGTVDDPRTRTTPDLISSSWVNIARLLQSIDTQPGRPGIDLVGLDLDATPVDFSFSEEAFGDLPAVQAALAASRTLGGTGVLVTPGEARQRLNAGTGGNFDVAELEDTAFFPVDPVPGSELCYTQMFSDGTGYNVCEDDIDEDPANAGETFRWAVDEFELELEFPAQGTVLERVTAQRLGITGNRIATQTVSECLTCDPLTEPAIEGGVLTVVLPLPLFATDLNGRTIAFAGDEGTTTVVFGGDGTGTLIDTGGSQQIAWAVGSALRNVLRIRGVGPPGGTLIYHELFVTEGGPFDGNWVALLGSTVDVDNDGEAGDEDFEAAGTLLGIDVLSAGAQVGR